MPLFGVLYKLWGGPLGPQPVPRPAPLSLASCCSIDRGAGRGRPAQIRGSAPRNLRSIPVCQKIAWHCGFAAWPSRPSIHWPAIPSLLSKHKLEPGIYVWDGLSGEGSQRTACPRGWHAVDGAGSHAICGCCSSPRHPGGPIRFRPLRCSRGPAPALKCLVPERALIPARWPLKTSTSSCSPLTTSRHFPASAISTPSFSPPIASRSSTSIATSPRR